MIRAIVQQRFPDSNKAVLVGLVRFMDLYGKVRLTYRDEDSPYDNPQENHYQRQIDRGRVMSISQYIVRCLAANARGRADVVFPNSIILACLNDDEDINEGNIDGISNVFGAKDLVEFPVFPNTLIVDGQHRYSGMKELYELAKESESVYGYNSEAIIHFIENYEFNCSILLNYDMWEQAQVFANVNFNQKKVNKSLFYDIYGVSIPLDDSAIIPLQNEIFFAHSLVSYLNKNEKSPLYGFVKMLGKGYGFVSQAFMVESLMKHLSPKGIWADAVTMLKSDNEHYNYVALELVAYLNSVRETFKVIWPESTLKKPNTILVKTTGLGAILMLLTDLHKTIKDVDLVQLKEDSDSYSTYAKIRAHFEKELAPLSSYAEELFSLDGKYASGSGVGMQTKLYKRMSAILQESKESME